MKKQVTKLDFENAFKLLSELNTPEVQATKQPLVESVKPAEKTSRLIEDYFNVSDMDDLETAKDERESEIAKAKLARIEKIVDLNASSEDELLGSYVGKMIIQCPQCMTVFYKDKEDIVADEADPNTVNVGEVCQHCGNDTGYMLLGKVAEVPEEELANYEAETGEEASEENMELDFTDTEEGAEEEATEEEAAEEEAAEETVEDTDLGVADLEEITDEEAEEEEVKESLNNSEALKDAEKHSELKTENESENLTLNEQVDENLEEGFFSDGGTFDRLTDKKLSEKLRNLLNSKSMSKIEAAVAAIDHIRKKKHLNISLNIFVQRIRAGESVMDIYDSLTKDNNEQVDENLEEGIFDKLKARHAAMKAAEQKAKSGRYVIEYIKYGDGKYLSEEGNVGSFARAKHFDTIEAAEKFVSEDGKFANWRNYYAIRDLGAPAEANECLSEGMLNEDGEISDAAIDSLFNSKEFKTPISEKEVRDMLATESLDEPVDAFDDEVFADIEDIDEDDLADAFAEAFSKFYNKDCRVVINECALSNKALTVSGKVMRPESDKAFTKLTAKFTEAVKNDSKISLKGKIVESKDVSVQANCKAAQKKLRLESLTCKGKVNGKICESFITRKHNKRK